MTRDQWRQLLQEDPSDPDRRLAFADWLEEQGLDPEAEVHRWLAREGKRPRLAYSSYRDVGQLSWDWVRADGEGDPSARVPEAVFRLLEDDGFDDLPADYREYPSRAAAEADLVRAWQQARAEGWQPDAGRPPLDASEA